MREPAVAGKFYGGSKSFLRKEIEECFRHALGPGEMPKLNRNGERKILGAVVPHAGYVYSGPIAAHVYGALARDGFPEFFIIIGPNHSYGREIAVTYEDFKTPLGVVRGNKDMAEAICGGIVEMDPASHEFEHSVEVQLPFLQYIKDDIQFIPIVMREQSIKASRSLGENIVKAFHGKDVVILASTDFTHCGMYYGQSPPRGKSAADYAKEQDSLAIDSIIKLDEKNLIETVERKNITMCGYGCVAAMMYAAKRLGAHKAKLLKYATSADVSGEKNIAVGYGAIIIEK